MNKKQLIANTLVLIFFLFMFHRSFELHEVRRFGEVGSGFWPFLILFSANILSIVLFIRDWRTGRQKEKEKDIKDVGRDIVERKKVILSILCLLLYVIAIPFIGFIISTLIFIFLLAFCLGERRRRVLFISPPLLTGLTVLVFAKFINMPLPKGIGIFAGLSRLFY